MPPLSDRAQARALAAVLSVLLATGWAANHITSLLPVLAEEESLSVALLDGVFGIYALGLLPGLFGGGALSDRLGRPRVVLPGALLATLGTLMLLVGHDAAGLLAGRFVVGLGAGLAFGAGTAWAADLGEKTGAVLAGVFLTGGFALGPLVSGVLGEWAPYPLVVPFVLSAALSLGAVVAARAWAVPVTSRPTRDRSAPVTVGSSAAALAWSLPVAVLVFASAAFALVSMPARLPASYDGPLLVGLSAVLTLGTGIVVQTLARRRSAGPRTGVLGAASSTCGFGLAAVGGAEVGVPLLVAVCVLNGAGYGLCLREGLLDVETLAPATRRGLLTGLFYVATYVGFGLPLLLTTVQPATGVAGPLVVCAAVAAAAAVIRAVQLRSGHPAR